MRAGCLRGLITIQRPIVMGSSSNVNFTENVVWDNWRIDVPCEIEVRRGREHFDSTTRQRYSEDVWIFRVRYDEVIGISSDMRVVYEGNEYDIKSRRADIKNRRDVLIECTIQDDALDGKALTGSIRWHIFPGFVGEQYEGVTVTAEGGTAPYSFAADGLPPGLSINQSGIIGGTPTQAGTFSVTVTISDAADTMTLPAFDIVVD